MRDIAERAGVGKATVSLALRDDPRLRAETRQRIQKLAAEMGYRANATVASLMAQLRASRSPKYRATLGLVNASSDPRTLTGLHTFREWAEGCAQRAAQLGYALDHFWLHQPGVGPARLAEILESRNIRGLIVAALLDERALPPAFARVWENFACVVVGIRPAEPALHFASNDQYATALRAVQELARLGYERPGLVIHPKVDGIVERRFSAGFWAGQEALGAAGRVPVFPFDPADKAGFRAWVEAHEPDGILCLHPEIRGWLEQMGRRVPESVGIAHLDYSNAELTGWAGMQQNNNLVGAAAVDLVIGQLHRNEAGVPDFRKSILIESTWVPGGTMPPRAPAMGTATRKKVRRANQRGSTGGGVRFSTQPKSASES